MPFTCGFNHGFSTGFAICPPAPSTAVPRQTHALGAGPATRPEYDHIFDVRLEGEPVRQIQRAGETLRRVTRSEREEAVVG